MSYEQKSPNERRSSRTKEDKEPREMVKCTCVQEDRLKLESINAFKFEFNLMSMQVSKNLEKILKKLPILIENSNLKDEAN